MTERDLVARSAEGAETRGARESLFPDSDLVEYVTETYGPGMGVKCEDIFNDDPENLSGFARSIRRSLTRELDRSLREERYHAQDSMRLHG